MAHFSDQDEILSVSDAIALSNRTLASLPLCIEGEVSEVSNKPGYKAVYFTIKDARSCLPCMMWVNKYHVSGVDLRVGALVRITGKLSIYAAKGRMTFDASKLELAGEGDLRQKVAQLAKKLEAEGLTDTRRKRALPLYPQVIGLVTSPRGAAVHDVLRTLRRRFPLARIAFAGVPVEGTDAPRGIIQGLREVAVRGGADVCLVVRGGGSFEDLMPFNDEQLARAIAACPVPVVTGIGHEPDTSIADLVADYRASTPTAAAEAVSPGEGELDAALAGMGISLQRALRRRVDAAHQKLDYFATRPVFTDSHALIGRESLQVDALSDRLMRAIPANLKRDEARLGIAAASLQALSPLAILGRGYAVAYKGEGALAVSAASFEPGEEMSVQFSDGRLDCSVLQVHCEPLVQEELV